MKFFIRKEAVGTCKLSREISVSGAQHSRVCRTRGLTQLPVTAVVVTLAPYTLQGKLTAGSLRVLTEAGRGHVITGTRGSLSTQVTTLTDLCGLCHVTGLRDDGGRGDGGPCVRLSLPGHLRPGDHNGEERHQRAQQLAEEHHRDQPQASVPQLTQAKEPHGEWEYDHNITLCLTLFPNSIILKLKKNNNQACPASFC